MTMMERRKEGDEKGNMWEGSFDLLLP